MGAEVATTKSKTVVISTVKGPLSELETQESGPLADFAAPAATLQTARQDRRSLTSGDVLHLQRTIGNRTVGQLLEARGGGAPRLIQPKLTDGAANDADEREADQMPGRARNLPSSVAGPPADAGIQRHFLGALKHLADEYIQSDPPDSLRVEDKEKTNLQRVTQESLRGEVNTQDPAKGDIIAYLHTKLTDAKDIPGLVKVVPKPELVTQLAKDLANRAGATVVSAEHTQAAQRDVDNGGGGFTTLDGLVFCLEGKGTSSALWHELIHVLSGPGGATPLAAFKTNLNEGFTNYFAEEVAASIGGAKFPAYPAATDWVRKFVTKYGRPAAYDVYFKSDVDSLYKLLAETYQTKLEAEKDKPTPGSAMKPMEVKNAQVKGAFVLDKLKTTVQGKLKNAQFLDLAESDLTWLDARCF